MDPDHPRRCDRPDRLPRGSRRVPNWIALTALLVCVLISPASPAQLRAETTVELRLVSGRVIPARLVLPVQTGERLPAVMLFGGFERGAGALDLVEPSRPTLLASFDYPLSVPRKPRFWEALGLLPEARRGIADSVEAMGLLYAHLRTREDVDPARITLVGVSLGAPFAVAAAAEYGIPGLAVVHGFGQVRQVIAHQFIRRWEPRRGAWVRPVAHALAAFLTGYGGIPDVEARARTLRAEQRVMMLIAGDDELVPAAATAALLDGFRASAAQVESEVESGGHLAGEVDPRIPALLARTERWMVDHGL